MVTAKLQLLKDTFESRFDIGNFNNFAREFFNGPEMLSAKRHTGIWKEYQDSIVSYTDIAKFKDAEGNKILVFAVELNNEKGVERARSLQRNFISKILDDNNCEAAIVAFYSGKDVNWRLSFVRLDYTIEDKGLKLDLTPAKRYSYLVGENETSHTAQKQLYPIFEDDKHNPTLDEIEEAFSVEKVTKDFFEQYKNKYYDLKEYLEKDEAFKNGITKMGFEVNRFSEQFAKKLMGQLAFLYFIQKKGWLGVRIMPENHSIQELIFNTIYNSQDNQHKEILKKVFSRAKDGTMKLSLRLFHSITYVEADLLSDCFVGTELDMPWGSGDKKFIRGIFNFCINNTNKNFFDDYLESFFYDALNKRRKNQYYKQFNCKVPFLNGGLFEPLEGYHRKETNFEIPNNIFSNVKEKGREADGILDIFDRYNFTMNEDEPLEKEVAVDPEMLGKIFENLLDGKDRKAKGAFYTPREIVHYMCQDSITNYLVNEVNVPYEDMKEFILYGELIRDADNRTNVGYGKDFTIKQSIFDKIVEIDGALKNIRIADPAVGSGAFPLGMLNEIVRARNNITEYLVRLDKSNKLDRKYGENYIRRFRLRYKMKWDTIKNSIFAVDIEPSAVDIAKLRLWISVVVEQEIDEENKEPHPLPNLDSNIMVGNSLIDEYEGIKLFDKGILHKLKNSDSKEKEEVHSAISNTTQLSFLIDHSDEMLKQMFELQDRLFDEDDEYKKKELKLKIDKIRDDLIEYKLTREGNREGFNKYNEMKQLKIKPFFIWELEFARVFKEKGGFDIVIGNPPYLGERKNKQVFTEVQESSFKKYYLGRMDYFYFFFHLGIDLLKDKGICSYITTNYYITALGARTLRADMKDRSGVIELINFNEGKVFNSAAGQHNMITTIMKGNILNPARIVVSNKTGVLTNNEIDMILSGKDDGVQVARIEQVDLWDGEENYLRLTGINNIDVPVNSILEKVRNGSSDLLGNICTPLIGLESSLDDVYVMSSEKVQDITRNDSGEMKNIKPFFKNSDVERYYVSNNSTKYILYLHEKVENIQSLKGIYSYLLEHEESIKNRKGANLRGAFRRGNWWVLNTPRLDMDFKSEKIVTPYRTKSLRFALSTDEWYASRDVYYIVKNKENISLRYILALLNSKLYYLWFYHRGKRKGDTLELYAKPLKEVPIKEIPVAEQQPFIDIVNQIIEKKKDKQNTIELERQIDLMIYKLYGLTHEEIKIVEG